MRRKSEVEPGEVKSIFTQAVDDSKNRSTFKNLFKKNISVADLQQDWRNNGYSDEISVITKILKSRGFSSNEISKVYNSVLANMKDASDDISSAVQKIADYAKKNGLADELKSILQKQYGFKSEPKKEPGNNLVVEDIRDIFNLIIHEDRTELNELIDNQNQNNLGRIRKK